MEIIKTTDWEEWDDFVNKSPQGTIFHTSYWLRASGKNFVIYGCYDKGELVGGLAIAYSKKLGIKYAHHPPWTPYLGIIFKEMEGKYTKILSIQKKICREMARVLKEDFDAVYFNLSPHVIDIQPFIWENFTGGIRYTYIVDIGDLNKVWREMDRKRRNDIISARKEKIKIINSEFKDVMGLVRKSFERQNKKIQFEKEAYSYNNILERKGMCKSFIAEKEGKFISAVYIIWDKRCAYYLLGGYDSEEAHHGATALAVWTAMNFARNIGLEYFDFEGSMIPEVEHFFRKFGGKLTPYYSVRWSRTWVKPLEGVYRLVRGIKW